MRTITLRNQALTEQLSDPPPGTAVLLERRSGYWQATWDDLATPQREEGGSEALLRLKAELERLMVEVKAAEQGAAKNGDWAYAAHARAENEGLLRAIALVGAALISEAQLGTRA